MCLSLRQAARDRIEEIYYFISDLQELVVKARCLARLATSLVNVDPEKRLENTDKIHTIVEDDLDKAIVGLLEATGDHYHLTQGIIRALAKTKSQIAFELTQKLNLETRRDRALLVFVESTIQMPAEKLDLVPVRNALRYFANENIKSEAIFKVITRLVRLSKKVASLPETLMTQALYFIDLIDNILGLEQRCKAYCHAHKILTKQDNLKYSGQISNLLNKLDAAWSAIDVQWIKIDIGFDIAKSLAEHAPEKAQQYLNFSKQLRDECPLDNETSALAYIHSLRLTLRAYSGLLPKHIDTPENLETLEELINIIPSYGEQAGLWAELALRLAIKGRLSECEHIVAEHVRPLLGKIANEDIKYQSQVIITVAPALFRAHPVTALERISKLPRYERDGAYISICLFLLQQHLPHDPQDHLIDHGYKDVSHEKIVSVCELLNLMESDTSIYYFIASITDALLSRHNQLRFPNEQKLDIAKRLEEIVSRKFPDPRNIGHDGYKILSQGHIARIKMSARIKFSSSDWENLIKEARKIPNMSDSSFILCSVAAMMPPKEAKLCKETLEEAMNLVDQIPSSFDKANRYTGFARRIKTIDRSMSKGCLKLAMELTRGNEATEFYLLQRRIVDIANQFDEDFAISLAKLLDDDPVRTKVSIKLQNHLDILKLRRQMANLSSNQAIDSKAVNNYSKAAWMNLGELIAGRIAPVHFDKMRFYIYTTASLPLSKSYAILAWVIENMVQRLANTDQAATYLQELYEAMLLGTRLTERISARSSKQLEQTLDYSSKLSSPESMVIPGKEREKAIQFLRNWFADTVQDYLKIHDPYFGPEDLEILQLLSLENPTCKVEILTSQEHNQKMPESWEKAYSDYWHTYISDYQEPPDTEITIIGLKSGKSPIQERWWITKDAGIRIGTSLNGLGGIRVSEISHLSKEEAEIRQQIVDNYLYGRKREHEGERLTRWQFPLLL